MRMKPETKEAEMGKRAFSKGAVVLAGALAVSVIAYGGTDTPVKEDARGYQKNEVVKGLKLDDEQKAKLKEMVKKNRKELRQYKQRLREKRRELARILKSDDIDVSKAEAVIDEISSIQKELLKARVRQAKELRGLLGPEKYKRFISRGWRKRRAIRRRRRWRKKEAMRHRGNY